MGPRTSATSTFRLVLACLAPRHLSLMLLEGSLFQRDWTIISQSRRRMPPYSPPNGPPMPTLPLDPRHRTRTITHHLLHPNPYHPNAFQTRCHRQLLHHPLTRNLHFTSPTQALCPCLSQPLFSSIILCPPSHQYPSSSLSWASASMV